MSPRRVMGRPDAAAAAKLTLLVAGEPDAVRTVEPLFGLDRAQ